MNGPQSVPPASIAAAMAAVCAALMAGPAAAEASFICNRLRDHGILIGTDGPYHNVLKIRPPLPFDKGNADFLVSALAKILAEDFG